MTLYKAATGELPFGEPASSGEQGGARWPQLHGEPKWPERVPEPAALQVMACLQDDPAARPTPAELHAQLAPVLDELPKPRLSRLKPRL